MGDIRCKNDNTWVMYASGHVSGSGTSMTGTLDEASDLNLVVSYPAAGTTNTDLPGVTFPEGTVLLQFPKGVGTNGVIRNVFNRTGYWNVVLEPGSGSATVASSIHGMVCQPLAHNSINGAYAFAFKQVSGSFQGYTVPRDTSNPGNMPCGWKFDSIGNKTPRGR